MAQREPPSPRDDLDAWLRSARRGLSPTDEVQQRVRSALTKRVGAPATQGPQAIGRSPRSQWRPTVTSALSCLALGGLLGFGLHASLELSPAAPVPALPEPGILALTHLGSSPPLEPEPPTPTIGTQSGIEARPRSVKLPSRTPQRSAPRAPQSDPLPPRDAAPTGLDAELRALQRAERALRSGNAALSLALLSDLETHGEVTLREELDALKAMGRCAVGEPAAAANARDFIARHPRSVHRSRVEELCAAEQSGSAL